MWQRTAHGDEGVTLVETVVAMLLFSVFAVVVGQYLIGTLRLTESNTQRVVAANLAAEQSELVRSTRTLDLPDGMSELPVRPVVDGTEYVLRRDVRFVAGPSGGSVCSGSADSLAYKLVAITVTWPGMGTVKPVRTDTLKTLGLGADEADVTKGAVAVAVQSAAGLPSVGRLVTVQPGSLSGSTGDDGCVVFPNLTPGVTYTATVDEAPYVGQQGEQRLTSTFSVLAAKVVKSSLTYERRASLGMTLTAPSGYSAPASIGVTLNSSVLSPSPTRTYADCSSVASSPQDCVGASGTLRSAAALFPATYAAWPGTCADAKPTSPPVATLPPGGNGTLMGKLGGLRVVLGSSASTTLGSKTLYAYHRTSPGSCPTGEVWPMVLSGSERRLALPPGSWDLVLQSNGGDVGTRSWPTATVRADLVATVVLP